MLGNLITFHDRFQTYIPTRQQFAILHLSPRWTSKKVRPRLAWCRAQIAGLHSNGMSGRGTSFASTTLILLSSCTSPSSIYPGAINRLRTDEMTYQLLAGGYRKTFTLLSFESEHAKLKTISDSPAPKNASWLEPSTKSKGSEGRIVYSLSEDEGKGKGVSLVIRGDKVEVTGERLTNGAPAHGKLIS
jgi:hypothetical protein